MKLTKEEKREKRSILAAKRAAVNYETLTDRCKNCKHWSVPVAGDAPWCTLNQFPIDANAICDNYERSYVPSP